MQERAVTIPELMLISGTRVALGVGVGLLISGKLGANARKAAGVALLAVGAMSTIPLVMEVLSKPGIPARLAAD